MWGLLSGARQKKLLQLEAEGITNFCSSLEKGKPGPGRGGNFRGRRGTVLAPAQEPPHFCFSKHAIQSSSILAAIPATKEKRKNTSLSRPLDAE